MRKFINIVSESVSNDLVLNQEIEAKLAESVPSQEDRTKVLDGLEIVHEAGPNGVTTAEWIARMKTMWPVNNEELKRIATLMTGLFGSNGNNLIKTNKSATGNSWTFVYPNHNDAEVDMSSPHAQMAKAQIHYTGFAQQLMRAAGTFTPSEIATRLAAGAGMPAEMAGPFVDHIISSSAAMVKPNGDGTYSWKEPAKKTGLSFLQDLEGYEPAKQYDIKLHHDGGSLIGIEALSMMGEDWIDRELDFASHQMQGNILYVEARYAPDIVMGMESDGLTVDKLTRKA